MQIADYILIVVLGAAVFSDLKFRKVWNWLTFSAMLLGLVAAYPAKGGIGLIDSLSGLSFMLAVGLIVYLIGFIGAGDAKLLAGIGALAGKSAVFSILIGSAVAGGVMAMAVILYNFGLKRGLGRALSGFGRMAGVKSVYPGAIDENRTRLPYAVAIAAGTIAWMVMR